MNKQLISGKEEDLFQQSIGKKTKEKQMSETNVNDSVALKAASFEWHVERYNFLNSWGRLGRQEVRRWHWKPKNKSRKRKCKKQNKREGHCIAGCSWCIRHVEKLLLGLFRPVQTGGECGFAAITLAIVARNQAHNTPSKEQTPLYYYQKK